MSISFVRQLGAEAGIQLNPLVDNSEIPTSDASDQVFAIIMRAARGRLDKPFFVDRSNVTRLVGAGEQIRENDLNVAWVQLVEALNNGAAGAVVQRLMGSGGVPAGLPSPKWASFLTNVSGTTAYWETQDEPDDLTEVATLRFALFHHECFNDGIKVAYHADTATGTELTIRLYDHADVQLFEFTGSVVQGSRDAYGNSDYLPDVISRQTDLVEMQLQAGATIAALMLHNTGIGFDTSGNARWCKSGVLQTFSENEDYVAADYTRCRLALQNTPMDYGYISAGGSESVAMVGELMTLAYETNRQFKLDIPGHLDPDAAITYLNQFNIGASPTAHLIHAFWAPILSDDPTGVNPRGYYGTATLNIAYCCRRNARTNAKGFGPKNYPIAGREWPIGRRSMDQTYNPSQRDLNFLARAKINPVLFETFTGGGRFVFRDSITCALVDSSLKKLISVADMSTNIDLAITRVGKDILQMPMRVAVKRMQDFMTTFFEDAQASGWLVPSSAPEMEGAAWKFDVKPNAVRPYDRMDVSYWLHYDGTTRQIFVTQTLSR